MDENKMKDISKAKITRLIELMNEITDGSERYKTKFEEIIQNSDNEVIDNYINQELKESKIASSYKDYKNLDDDYKRFLLSSKNRSLLKRLYDISQFLYLGDNLTVKTLNEVFIGTESLSGIKIDMEDEDSEDISQSIKGGKYFFCLLKNILEKTTSEEKTHTLDEFSCKTMEDYILLKTPDSNISSIYLNNPQKFLESNFYDITKYFPEYIIHKKKNNDFFNDILLKHANSKTYENALDLEKVLKTYFNVKNGTQIKINHDLRELYDE